MNFQAKQTEAVKNGWAGLISTFIRHPNAANLLMVLMIIFGAFAIAKINTQFFPTVDRPNIGVYISWPGASAQDVEVNVLAVAEPELRFINGVERMTSTASEGNGAITLEFAEGANMQEALSEVEAAAKAIGNLPEDAETPEVRRSQFFDAVARLSISGSASESVKRDWAKRVRDDLIDRGIDKINFSGLRASEISITVPERELRRLSTTVSEISSIIGGNSRDIPSGNVDGDIERQLRALANARNINGLRDVEIKSFPTGEKVKLGDIAKIEDSFNSSDTRGLSDNLAAIELDVRRAPSADTLETAAILFDYIEEIRPQLPDNIELKTYRVSSEALSERILLLVKNAAGGLLIVVLTLFIFLNARIAFWVAAGIPIALLATIGFMLVIGQTINMITLFTLIMMLGIIVDDAIVVGEHTNTRLEAGDDNITAAENGVGMMMTPVMAAMLTTLAAFSPILLINDTIGQIMGVLPYVVIAVLIASLIECFLILPGHLAHSLRTKKIVRWSYWRQFFIALIMTLTLAAILNRLSIGADKSASPLLAQLADMPSFMRAALAALSALTFATIIEFIFIKLLRPFITFTLTSLGCLILANIYSSLASGSGEFENIRSFIGSLITIPSINLMVAGIVTAVIIVLFSEISVRRKESKMSAEELEAQRRGDGWFRRNFDARFNWFRDNPFHWLVRLSYNWRYVTIAFSAGLVMVLAVGLIKSGKVEFVFFPSPEAENITGIVVFNAGLPEDQALKAIETYEKSLRDADDKLTDENEQLVSAIFTTFGASNRNGAVQARINVQLTASEFRSVRTNDIVSAWRREAPRIAGIQRFSVAQSRGGPPGRDVEVRLQGDSSEQLKAAANDVAQLLSTLEGVSGVEDNLPYGKPELVMQLTPFGSALGFSIDNVGRQIRNSFEGNVPFRFARGDDEVTVRVSAELRESGLAALRNLSLKGPSGQFVPLTEIVDLSERQGFASIKRRDGKTTISVSGDIDNNVSTTDKVTETLTSAGELASIAAKHGVTYSFGGRSEEQKNAFSDLRLGAIIAIIVIYIILAWFFGSYWQPLAVMMIIPFGIVGAVFGHWLMGFKLTILSFIGLLGLSGILVNDSIILVARLNERLREGVNQAEAAIGASLDRLRAVMLTSLTTIGGLLPLLFETSRQAQFLLPMAITIVFGLALSTFLVLFLVPALVGVGNDIRTVFAAIFGQIRENSPNKATTSNPPAE
ncbi:efflux RND transporter permease subunit [Lentilitoribacter sp. Alg239-R112]|uniref:efflux RND transporter permease subunit n=1 Tax=Lentilitoribacter sp. Alg239-R112 TaxID=2305987 RepID=UPI0013A6B4B1|nr:efflux RND transporter permease subunit [Lentilitoribacter sp. Alg239-R112]